MIANNIGTIIVAAILSAIVIFILRYLRKNKAQGKSSCGCNCAGCAMRGKCHGDK